MTIQQQVCILIASTCQIRTRQQFVTLLSLVQNDCLHNLMSWFDGNAAIEREQKSLLILPSVSSIAVFDGKYTSFSSITQVYCTKNMLFYAVQSIYCTKTIGNSHSCPYFWIFCGIRIIVKRTQIWTISQIYTGTQKTRKSQKFDSQSDWRKEIHAAWLSVISVISVWD